jgi:uncharacterized membrane protein YccF (DUF307 family)
MRIESFMKACLLEWYKTPLVHLQFSPTVRACCSPQFKMFNYFAVVWLLTAGWLLILARLIIGGLLVLSVVGYAAGVENFRAIPWTAWPFGYVVAQITRVPDYPYRSANPSLVSPAATATGNPIIYSPETVV